MFSVGGGLGVYFRIFGSMNFSSNDDVFSGNLEVDEDFSKLSFSITGSIELGCVEVVNAVFQGHFNDFFILLISLRFVVDHVSEGDGGNLEPRISEVIVGHLSRLKGRHIFQLM